MTVQQDEHVAAAAGRRQHLVSARIDRHFARNAGPGVRHGRFRERQALDRHPKRLNFPGEDVECRPFRADDARSSDKRLKKGENRLPMFIDGSLQVVAHAVFYLVYRLDLIAKRVGHKTGPEPELGLFSRNRRVTAGL